MARQLEQKSGRVVDGEGKRRVPTNAEEWGGRLRAGGVGRVKEIKNEKVVAGMGGGGGSVMLKGGCRWWKLKYTHESPLCRLSGRWLRIQQLSCSVTETSMWKKKKFKIRVISIHIQYLFCNYIIILSRSATPQWRGNISYTNFCHSMSHFIEFIHLTILPVCESVL